MPERYRAVVNCGGCTRRAATLALVLLAAPRAFAKCTDKGVDVGDAKAFTVGTFKIINNTNPRINFITPHTNCTCPIISNPVINLIKPLFSHSNPIFYCFNFSSQGSSNII
jgi:hypothetical protein